MEILFEIAVAIVVLIVIVLIGYVKTTDYVPNAEYINVKVDATVKIRIGQPWY